MTLRKVRSAFVLSPLIGAASLAHAAYTPVYGGPTFANPPFSGYYAFGASALNSLTGRGIGVNVYNYYDSSGNNNGPRGAVFTPNGFTPLSTITPYLTSGGQSYSSVYAINASGEVAGGETYITSSGTNLGYRPVVWNSGGAVSQLDISQYGTSSSGSFTGYAESINATGTSAGYVSDYDSSGNQIGRLAVRWSPSGTATTLAPLNSGGYSGYSAGYAVATSVNNNSVAVGVASTLNSAGSAIVDSTAVRWDVAGNITALGKIATNSSGLNPSTTVTMVNDSNVAVGSENNYDSSGNQLGTLAVRWDANGNATALGLAGGATPSASTTGVALAVNASGTAVGNTKVPSGASTTTYATRWDPGSSTGVQLSILSTVVAGGTTSYASGINSEGFAAGYVATGASTKDAVYWAPNGSVVDLNSLIDPTSGFLLTQAFSITDDGWISGNGTYTPTDGTAAYTRSFLLQVAVPEPTSLAVLGLVAAVPMLRRRRATLATKE